MYDGKGSLISEKEGEKTTSYRYDLLNRQEKIWTSDGREQENLYDGEGLRAGLREKGKESVFLFYNGEILAECDGDGMPVRRHLSGMGLSHMQTLDDGMYHACYQDEQGSTAFITGDGGAVENSYVYDAFGNVLERKEEIRNDILYRGQKYDQEAGQYYLRARYYNPIIGRFIQEDTYRGDGLNLYAYCGNNPVMYYDPSGHTKVTQPVVEPEVPMAAGEGGFQPTELVPYYPSNDGAVAGTKHNMYLMPGDIIDRYGNPSGKYFSPTGTPMEMRALPYNADLSIYTQYEVLKPFEVEASTIAPAFGKIGLGTQYRSCVNADVLVKHGIIKQIGGL